MNIIQRMRDLAKIKDGYTLALVTKVDLADLVCLIDQCVSTGGGDILQAALIRNVELRNELAAVTGHNHTLADIVRQKDSEARNHGDERRRFMGNNRALLARVEQLEATVAEMGSLVDDLGTESEEWHAAYKKNLGRLMLAESRLAMVVSLAAKS
jgi:signal transduction histidine kinase